MKNRLISSGMWSLLLYIRMHLLVKVIPAACPLTTFTRSMLVIVHTCILYATCRLYGSVHVWDTMCYPIARKFGRELNLAVCVKTAKLKSAKFFYVCMYVWRYRTIPPNLIPILVLKTSFWAKPPHLMTANISGYTVI